MNLGTQLQGIAAGMIATFGDAVTVNGEATSAFFERLSSSQIQSELEQDEWHEAVYAVELPAAVLAAPFHLKAKSVIVWSKHGWTLRVRRLPDTPGLNDADLTIVVLAIVIPSE